MNAGNVCGFCLHYRRPVPLSVIVKQQVTESHEDVVKAIDDVSAKDNAHRIEEKAWISAGASGEGVWPHRPRTTPYCGLYESHEHYYVCEVKNGGGDCADFRARAAAPTHDCSGCAHRVPASGDSKDQALLYQIAERMSYSSVQCTAMQAEYARLEKGIGAMKAYEIREVHRNFGWLHRPPRFFDCCSARSIAARFEVPQALNSRGDCDRFLEMIPPPPVGRGSASSSAPRTRVSSWQSAAGELRRLLRI